MANLDLGALQIGVSVNTGTAIRELNNLRRVVQQTENSNDGLSTSFNSLRSTVRQAETSNMGLTASFNGLRQSIHRIDFNNLNQKLSSFGNNMTTKVTLPLVAMGAAMFKLGSDLEETINKVDVIFKENKQTVKDWGATALDTMGMAKGSALEMAALFGDMGNGMGLESEIVKDYSMSLTQLAADLASFKNIKIDQAKTALTGVYTGETEALKSLGIVMTEVNLQEYARREGVNKLVRDMSQAEKVMLRYNFVMDATKTAQGDYERTSDSAANQTRELVERLKELGATLGQELIPIITPMVVEMNEAVEAFGDMDEGAKEFIVKAGLMVAAIGPITKALVGLSKAVGLVKTASTAFSAFGSAVGVGAGVLGIYGIAVAGVVARISDLVKTYKEANEIKQAAITLDKDGTDVTWDKIEALDEETRKGIEIAKVYKEMQAEQQALEEKYLELNEAMSNELLENGESDKYKELRQEFDETLKSAEDLRDTLIGHSEVLTANGGTVESNLKFYETWIKEIDLATEKKKALAAEEQKLNQQIAEGVQLSEDGQKYISELAGSYSELVSEQGLSAEQLEELAYYEKVLVDMFGEEIIIRDELGRGIGLKISMMQDESLAYGHLTDAKRRAVNAMAELGRAGVNDLKLETLERIKALQIQIAAYDASVLTQGQIAVMAPQIEGAKKQLEQLKADVEAYGWIIDKTADPYRTDTDDFKKTEKEKTKTFEEQQEERISIYEAALATRKHYNDLSLADELEGYRELLRMAEGNAEEQERLYKELFRVKQEMLRQETEEVERETQRQIEARQRVLDQEISNIEFGLSEELAELQGELDRIDYEQEQARIDLEKKEKQIAIDDARQRLSLAVTEEERFKAMKDLEKSQASMDKFNNDLRIKEEKRRIQEEMRLAREKAEQAKAEKQKEYENDVAMYEIAKNAKLEKMEEQYQREFELETGKRTDFNIVEEGITQDLINQYNERNRLFAVSIGKDLSEVEKVKKAISSAFNPTNISGSISSAFKFNVPGPVPSIAQIQEAYKGQVINDNSNMTINQYITPNHTDNTDELARKVANKLSQKIKQYRANKGGSRK